MKIEVVKDGTGLWRIKNAPIISTGIEYPLSSGPHTFTESELADAVKAAKNDPAIVEPRIKLGHTSDYNEALIGDAEMAFGRIDKTTLTIGDNGQTIYGDYLVPEWLGTVMPIAFPNRSIEGSTDVTTATGKNYEMVINAVSLLGIYWPGCQVLEDLPLWYGAEIPDGVEFDEYISAQLEANQIAASGGSTIIADADVSRVRQQFYKHAMEGTLEGTDGLDTYWWWVRAERYSDKGGMYLIVDSEEGDLYRVDVTVSKNDVTFSKPTQVRVEYVKAAAVDRAAVVAGMAVMDDRLAVHASRADTEGPDTSTQRGASRMDVAKRKALAASCGLPEDATEEQIKARLKQIRASAEDAGVEDGENVPSDQGAGPDTGGPEADRSEEDAGTHQTPPGTAPSGTAPGGDPNNPGGANERTDADDDTQASTVRVDRATWEQTQSDAALARRHENERVTARQHKAVEDAISAGKLPPARREHYRKLMAADEQGTTQLIDSLERSAVPLGAPLGDGGDGDSNSSVAAGVGLPNEWFPEIVASQAAAAAAKPVMQAREG